MHIRRSHCDVPQSWGSELADVLATIRELVQAGVWHRIRELAADVVQPGVLKNNSRRIASFITKSPVEVPTPVALEATRPLAGKEQQFSPLRRIREGV